MIQKGSLTVGSLRASLKSGDVSLTVQPFYWRVTSYSPQHLPGQAEVTMRGHGIDPEEDIT